MIITLNKVVKAVLILSITVQIVLLFTSGFDREQQRSFLISNYLLLFSIYYSKKEQANKTK